MMIPPKQAFLQKRLLMSAALTLGVLVGGERLTCWVPRVDYRARLEAATLVQQAEQLLRTEKQRRGIKLNPQDDPAGTGLIGPKFSAIVTDGSTLAVKRTATNPNLAAAVVGMLHELGVQPGDPIAICMTGSMPGADLAVLAAVKAVGARPTIIASVGPSTWGATDPSFTWLDMASIVEARGLMRARPLAATPGGTGDAAVRLPAEALKLMRAAADRNRIPFVVPAHLSDAVQYRLRTFAQAQGGLPKVLVNVGGSAANYGTPYNAARAPGPVIPPQLATKLQPQGLIYLMLRQGVPVIHLHQLDAAAKSLGLPVNPTAAVPVPSPRELYYVESRPRVALAAIWVALVVALVFLLRMGGVVPLKQIAEPQPGSAADPPSERN